MNEGHKFISLGYLVLPSLNKAFTYLLTYLLTSFCSYNHASIACLRKKFFCKTFRAWKFFTQLLAFEIFLTLSVHIITRMSIDTCDTL